MQTLVKGLVIGFSIAAPVGPIGLLCIRRSLTDGRLAGFVSGLGAATADAIYGLVAALGLTAIMTALVEHRAWLQLSGGAFLLYLGIATLRTRPGTAAAHTGVASNLRTAYLSILALTLTNPMTILSFIGIFAGLGLDTSAAGIGPACRLVLGVFLGSAAWWLFLSTAAGWLGRRLTHTGLRSLHVCSGLIIAGFGVWQLIQLARES